MALTADLNVRQEDVSRLCRLTCFFVTRLTGNLLVSTVIKTRFGHPYSRDSRLRDRVM